MFTFVIPARDEQDSVATIVRQACHAAQPGDRVVVVDSALNAFFNTPGLYS